MLKICRHALPGAISCRIRESDAAQLQIFPQVLPEAQGIPARAAGLPRNGIAACLRTSPVTTAIISTTRMAGGFLFSALPRPTDQAHNQKTRTGSSGTRFLIILQPCEQAVAPFIRCFITQMHSA
ncbi:hypothetical protein [Desulfovibrio sp.]|uniref:hypothetical protein n=1 Tax=Desulfovibrio sp. TaxID=885 RepID=UPI0025C45A1A|nr:hypothetical protein [Desulfovibrio sp.]